MRNYGEITDQDLIALVISGNDIAFLEIVKRYENTVANIVIGMIQDTPEAEDVGQEVFIRFYKSISKFRNESQLSTYLTRIAINLSLNELKRRKTVQSRIVNKDGLNSDKIDESDNQERVEIKELVRLALDQLEPNFKSVIVLRMIDGYSTKEVADILEIPIGTVLSRLSRAQKKIKEILTPSIQ